MGRKTNETARLDNCMLLLYMETNVFHVFVPGSHGRVGSRWRWV